MGWSAEAAGLPAELGDVVAALEGVQEAMDAHSAACYAARDALAAVSREKARTAHLLVQHVKAKRLTGNAAAAIIGVTREYMYQLAKQHEDGSAGV